jgi:hypothetical protein
VSACRRVGEGATRRRGDRAIRRWGDGAKGRKIWWGEAPERPRSVNEELKIRSTEHFASPIRAPSRGPAFGNLEAFGKISLDSALVPDGLLVHDGSGSDFAYCRINSNLQTEAMSDKSADVLD